MNRTKPNIGVTGPARGGTMAWLCTKFAVWLQGGKAIRITPEKPPGDRPLDGLILGGGADIDPEQYGRVARQETETYSSGGSGFSAWMRWIFSLVFYPLLFLGRKIFSVPPSTIDRSRDELELNLLEQALERRLPVLGICRGAQLINVKLGGTLHQEIRGFFEEVPQMYSVWPRKEVDIEPGSKLGKIVGSSQTTVNALHRQAVETLGEPLTVVAREKSGVIQAVEHPGYSYLIGVQWHPEYMPQVRCQRKIFEALIDRASDKLNGDQVSTL